MIHSKFGIGYNLTYEVMLLEILPLDLDVISVWKLQEDLEMGHFMNYYMSK